ncbi:Aldehyde dehydrogenase [Lunasporangiospora selenospora]|uniref:Aldehyde dehydrogenase n=1 Tax=Lunasporangiospora selenospora TaxID=979761 RepID=A0A9P6FTN1_9FUNG|nr:Aldehyde dehydrogenase [Lunasporangiospora selenospora]
MTTPPSLRYNTEAEIQKAIETSRRTFQAGVTRPLAYRRQQLERLWKLLDENSSIICDAVWDDLRKPKNEVILGEIAVIKQDIAIAYENLEQWAKDEPITPSFLNRLGTTCVQRKEPRGSALLISPWNYPIQLALTPLVGVIAAGCTAVIKPSELAPSTAKLLADLVPLYLDPKSYILINGAIQETTQLLAAKWDHIFYTGNGAVAKIVMRAAAEHLTTLTLELGGKSPVFVLDDDANMKLVAKRISFGKTFNAGQSCIAPDYVLVTEKSEAKLIEAFRQSFEEMFGKDPKKSPDLGRIICHRHFHRIKKLLDGTDSSKIVVGGQTDESELYFAPTIVANVSVNDPLMSDELFAPILPLIRVRDVDEAIEIVNAQEDALALYVFSNDKKQIKKILDSTRSGGVCVNDTMMHVGELKLPFGGIGPSGMGAYHGKASFDTFTHTRSTMVKKLSVIGEKISEARYAPYSEKNLSLGRWALEPEPPFKKGVLNKGIKWVILAVLLSFGYKRYSSNQ